MTTSAPAGFGGAAAAEPPIGTVLESREFRVGGLRLELPPPPRYPRLRKLREMVWSPSWSGIMVRVTNLGLGFVLMTLVVAIGATNTGNNGLYLLMSLFMGALMVSGFVSRRNVEKLAARLEGPTEVYAGQPARFTLTLENKGRLPRRALLVKISGAAAPILFAEVGRVAEVSRGVDLVFPRRGRRTIDSLLVYSGYPIGLFRKGRLHPIGQERVVFPAPISARAKKPDPREVESGDPHHRRRGRGHEVRNLREAGIGDDPRDVHWPQTARQGRFIVRERAADEGRDAVIVLETRRPPGAPRSWELRFERAVCEAAALATQLLARGNSVGLVAGPRTLPTSTGPAHRRAILTALALVESSEDAPPTPALPHRLSVYSVRVEPEGAV